MHLPERIADLASLKLGDPITPQAVGSVLTHSRTYTLKILLQQGGSVLSVTPSGLADLRPG